MQATNKYYPSDYDGKKTANQLANSHALGHRARKLDKGHIGQGVRYNAEKKKVGNYYTSPIWEFRIKCHLCQGFIVIHTNPKETSYDIKEGARKQSDWSETDPTIPYQSISTEGQEADPFEQLEKTVVQNKEKEEKKTTLNILIADRDKYWSDPYTQSQRLRKVFRAERKIQKEKAKVDADFTKRMGLSADFKILDKQDNDTNLYLSSRNDNGKAALEAKHSRIRTRASNGNIFWDATKHNKLTKNSNLLQSQLLLQAREENDPFTKTASSTNHSHRDKSHHPSKRKKSAIVDYESDSN